jgi:hypothetical protein
MAEALIQFKVFVRSLVGCGETAKTVRIRNPLTRGHQVSLNWNMKEMEWCLYVVRLIIVLGGNKD